jgi:hypothetical protein
MHTRVPVASIPSAQTPQDMLLANSHAVFMRASVPAQRQLRAAPPGPLHVSHAHRGPWLKIYRLREDNGWSAHARAHDAGTSQALLRWERHHLHSLSPVLNACDTRLAATHRASTNPRAGIAHTVCRRARISVRGGYVKPAAPRRLRLHPAWSAFRARATHTVQRALNLPAQRTAAGAQRTAGGVP